jgi:hypothetical protein
MATSDSVLPRRCPSSPFPNSGLARALGSMCRVCSGGNEAELTKLDGCRSRPSIQENSDSANDGRTVERDGAATAGSAEFDGLV